MIICFDIESDGLLREATKIHCLSYFDLESKEPKTYTDYRDMKRLLEKENLTLIGHNIVVYDCVLLERILGIKITARKIDTLPLSWYLYPDKKKHGLEHWGEEFDIKKPKIADWQNLTVEEYSYRCSEDVKINTKLWEKQKGYLYYLYDKDEKQYNRLINYLSFKMECIREQEEIGIRLNVEYCQEVLSWMMGEKERKMQELLLVMPKVPVKKKKDYLGVMDQDGNVSQPGELFYSTIKPVRKVTELSKIKSYKEPKPTSSKQLKDWLYSLGWHPENIKQQRNKKTGDVKKIEQIMSKDNDGSLCPSVKKLFKKEPKLEILEGLSVLTHRIGILKGFLKDAKDGILYPSAVGLTNTLRYRHKVVVNLPGVGKKYAEEIRSCLAPYEGHVLLGADLANIEDRTKRHYIYKYDPAYVEEMNRPDYDAHLDIGIMAGMITEEESEFYKSYKPGDEGKDKYNYIKAKRGKTKIVNFSATYKIGAPALARNSGMPIREAEKLLKIYWERNKAILQVEDSLEVKEIGAHKWQKNPVSGYWYSLRADKDKFSTLNQGTAVYCMDLWVTYLRKLGLKISFQMHDEVVINILPEQEEETKELLKEAISRVNNKLELNIEVGCSGAIGNSYWQIH